ncbi:Serine/threonine protein kinase, partial [Globisporangium splendens]
MTNQAEIKATRDEIVKAAKEGGVEAIRQVVLQCSDAASCLNGLGSIGVTPLYMAVLKGNVELVTYLLASGASPLLPTAKGRSPLFAAILSDSLEILNLLIEAGASIHETGGELLFEATRRGRFEIATWLLESGVADVHFVSPISGMTPLFAAASFGNTQLAAKFLSKGADVNLRTNKGQTPLFVAALLGHLEMVRFLLEHGATVEPATEHGETPLSVACGWGHLDVVQELVKAGATVESKNDRGETPLFAAISRGNRDVVRYLLDECRASGDLTTASGETLLSVAQSHDLTEIVKLLQDHFVVAPAK